MKNIVKYSCNSGNYDKYIKDDRIYINPSIRFQSNRLNAKIIKILPHLFLPKEVEYSIWVDSNIELLIDNESFIEEMGDKDCMVFKHPYRNTINEEIKECTKAKLDHLESMNYHKDREGELAASGVIVRKHTEEVKKYCLEWWAEICRGSIRDQLSFPYTLGKISKYKKTDWIFPFQSKYTKWVPHNHQLK